MPSSTPSSKLQEQLSAAIQNKNNQLEQIRQLIAAGADINKPDDSRGITPLHWAAWHGHVEIAKYLVGAGANVRALDADGQTPLHWTTSCGSTEMIKYLVKETNAGADINKPDKHGITPLHWAVCWGSTEMVKYLVEETNAGADINAGDAKGKTPLHLLAETHRILDNRSVLHWGVANGSVEMAKYLVEAGANVNARDAKGKTPLHQAAMSGSVEMARYLVEAGANINACDTKGRTPLLLAIMDGHIEATKYFAKETALHMLRTLKNRVFSTPNNTRSPSSPGLQEQLSAAIQNNQSEQIQQLIKKGADIYKPDSIGQTPLHVAVGSAHVAVVKYLVDVGADIHTPDNDGRTPLNYAAGTGSVEMAKCLVDAGADIHTPDVGGCTSLHWAIAGGSVEMAKYLVSVGADIDKPDVEGCTPLHWSITSGSVEVAKYLVGLGVDVHTPDNIGGTPLHVAAWNGSVEVAKYLVEETDAYSDIDTPDNNGQTPLQLATANGHVEVERYLLKAIARRTLKDRILPGLIQEDAISSEPVENPATTILNPLYIYSLKNIEKSLKRSPEEPFTTKPLDAGDIIPAFSARNVFLVAARNAQASENNTVQFDRTILKLELSLLDPESILCAEHYLEQFCKGDKENRVVYLPKGTRQRTDEEQRLFEILRKRIFIGSEDGKEAAEMDILTQHLHADGSIKPILDSQAEEPSLSAELVKHPKPLVLSGRPPQGSSPGSPQRSNTFQTMFGNVNIPKEYKEYQELKDAKKLTWAQEVHVHNHLRSEQIALLEEIKNRLLSDSSPDDQEDDDQKHAKIFYGVLRAMKENLKREHRWTALLGISTHSRLEHIIDKHLKELDDNPALGSLKDTAPITTMGLSPLVGDNDLMRKISQLIEPKSFMNRVMGFIKDLKDSAESIIRHKPKH